MNSLAHAELDQYRLNSNSIQAQLKYIYARHRSQTLAITIKLFINGLAIDGSLIIDA